MQNIWPNFRTCSQLAWAIGPEATTDLRNGFVMADVVSLRTLLIKIPGLMLSVAAGGSLRVQML